MYNVNAGLVPSYIADLIPPLVSEISDYPLGNKKNIFLPYKSTNISQKSCIPSSIRLWNGLEDDLKQIPTLTTFKKHVHSKFNKSYIPSYFTSLNSFVLLEHLAMLLISTLKINCLLRNFLNKAIGIINFAKPFFKIL